MESQACFVTPPIASFKGNELIYLEGDHFSSSVVMSTGDPKSYEIEVSIRAGVTHKFYTDVPGVAQHVVDSVVNGKRMVRNVFFPGGMDTAVGICRSINMKNRDLYPERYARAEEMEKERQAEYEKQKIEKEENV